MIKQANLESLMPTIYTKLKSLGEINDVVPISNIVSGLSRGDARAYVSNEDKNSDGIPDKIYIVYPRLNIDLQQDLNGITTADIMAFPNVESQKTHQVSNILATITNVLNHEQDHLGGFSPGDNGDEFSPEHSAEHAGDEAVKKFINKYTYISKNIDGRNNIMITELKKLSSHLRRIEEGVIADTIDTIIRRADDNRTGEDIVRDTDDSIAWLTSLDSSAAPKSATISESDLLVTASDEGEIKTLAPHDDLMDSSLVSDAIEKVNEAKKELKIAKEEREKLRRRMEERGEGAILPSIVAKVGRVNAAIADANAKIQDVRREKGNTSAFLASLGKHSDSAGSVEQADDESFNLDNLFASSIIGSRNIK